LTPAAKYTLDPVAEATLVSENHWLYADAGPPPTYVVVVDTSIKPAESTIAMTLVLPRLGVRAVPTVSG